MSKHGLVVDGEGWFVINARESRWKDEGPLGSYCTFEGKRRFPQLGINISVLEPGERIGMYHRENAQEGFLVIAGECTLIVEGEERRLTQWDFFHCAPGTEHIIVASGDQSAIVVAVGARGRGVGGGVVYKVCEAAPSHGASVVKDAYDPAVDYANVGRSCLARGCRAVPARLARRIGRRTTGTHRCRGRRRAPTRTRRCGPSSPGGSRRCR